MITTRILFVLAIWRVASSEDPVQQNQTYLEKRQEHEASKMVEMEEADIYLRHPHMATLDSNGKIHLAWATDFERQEIVLEITAETIGWVAFGLSPSRTTKKIDLLTGWVDSEGKGHIQDRYGAEDEVPLLDAQQDWRLLRATENDTHTVLVVSRDLSTCDDQDLVITNTTKRVIYAYGVEDPSNATTIEYLSEGATRGSRYLLLLQPAATAPPSPEDTQTWSLSQRHSLSGEQGAVRWCNIVKFPHARSQVHYVGFDIEHGENSLGHLHQVILWECAGDPNSAAYRQERERLMHYASQEGHECYSPNMPLDYNRCNNPVVVWAAGGGGAREPGHLGVPMLPSDDEKAFFLVEAHYDNPTREEIDVEWGVDVYFTENLREFESASMFVGNTINFAMLVPPATDQWTTTGHCPAGCLMEGVSETGIKVYQVFLRAHTLGRSIRVRHFRDGKELPPIAADDYYDFDFQQAVPLQEERTILPSDHITTECLYDSSERVNTSFAGHGPHDEICMAVLSYYPRHSVVECTSSTHHDVLKKVFGIQQLQNEQNLLIMSQNREPMDLLLPKRQTSLHTFVNGLMWSEMDVKNVEKQLSRGTHVSRCMKRGGIPAQAIKLKTGYPEATTYTAPENLCPRMLGHRTYGAGASANAFSYVLLLSPLILTLIWQQQ